MIKINQQEGRYRVLLIGVGGNTEAEKDSLCCNISKDYSIPFLQLKKIVNRSPLILKKNLPLRKAKLLAKTLESFGAVVSVEERRETLPISLEFQELAPHRLSLESCSLRRSQTGTWSVIGRAKNISEEILEDIWVLIQVFGDHEEFLAFDETPLPINPLPSGYASPFKLVFEGTFSVKKISVGFKDASGQVTPVTDGRKKIEWVKADLEEDHSLYSAGLLTGFVEKSGVAGLPRPPEKMIWEKKDEITRDIVLSSGQEAATPCEHGEGENYREVEGGSEESILVLLGPTEKTMESSLISVREEDSLDKLHPERVLEKEASESCTLPLVEELGEAVDTPLDGDETVLEEAERKDESRLSPSVFQEATQLLQDISKNLKNGEAEGKTNPSLSWIEYFRNEVETFYRTPHDIFSIWFEERREKGEIKNSLQAILTILAHSRFDQGSQSTDPLENTKKSFRFVVQQNLSIDEIPALEGTSFASGEVWRKLLLRAHPKLHQVGNAILEKGKWNFSDLERLIQVIPYMGIRNSRMAIQWINELVRDVAEIDFSNAPILIEKCLYRVAARLGIVDPHEDYYNNGKNSMANTKIQSFAVKAFPQNPVRIEKPMMRMGDGEGPGGHCFPIQPLCNGCLFETFCPKLHLEYDPSEKGKRN